MAINLIRNPDIIKNVSLNKNKRPKFVVGFAAETNDYINNARKKLITKKCDLIIANKISSIDVDKIDYIQRDSYHIGFGLSEKYERLITMCRVVNFEGNRTLAWPEKLQDEILSLFETRYRLHKKVYNHHTVKAGEYIITEILDNMLENVDLHFSKLNDAMILFPVNEKVIALKEKIDKRELPKMIGERVLSYNEVTEEVKQFEQKLDNVVAILNGCNIENRGWSKIKIVKMKRHYI